MTREKLSGARIVLRALKDQGVSTVFGYPGGAVLPIYDALVQQNELRHVLVRHEQGAVHAAEGYARSTGEVGVVLVTSGPGATNTVTGLLDALCDSIPLVCITGQVPTSLIGNDAFQEADTTGITRPCTKHNYLVKDVNDLARTIHEAFHIARSGRPGPVVVDLPKDVQFALGDYVGPTDTPRRSYNPRIKPESDRVAQAVEWLAEAKRPILYVGGGVVNSGPEASRLLRELAREVGAPVTATLMGLGAFPASDEKWLGMLGMHGTLEANMAMYDCDLMVAIGARFDDRVTGRVDGFSPNSRKIHIDIDPSSINKNVLVDLPIIGDCGAVLEEMLTLWRSRVRRPKTELAAWWSRIDSDRARYCLSYERDPKIIKPQHALEALRAALRGTDHYIATEVGQHQMWSAQFMRFDEPRRWLTSGGLGTMGYGLPAAIGAQIAHPDAIVVDIAGEASIQMNIQELATAVQHKAPVKVFIMNNDYMGMVRQWQELHHGKRYSESFTGPFQPDFVKLADAFGCAGLRAETVDDLERVIARMLEIRDRPVIVDVRVDPDENCFPMIPGGKAHNEILLGPGGAPARTPEEGMVLV